MGDFPSFSIQGLFRLISPVILFLWVSYIIGLCTLCFYTLLLYPSHACGSLVTVVVILPCPLPLCAWSWFLSFCYMWGSPVSLKVPPGSLGLYGVLLSYLYIGSNFDTVPHDMVLTSGLPWIQYLMVLLSGLPWTQYLLSLGPVSLGSYLGSALGPVPLVLLWSPEVELPMTPSLAFGFGFVCRCRLCPFVGLGCLGLLP